MKRRFFIFSALALIFNVCRAQQNDTHIDPLGYQHIDTSSSYIPCLIEREGYKPVLVRHIIMTNKDCESSHFYQPTSEALKLYGNEHIILTKLKPGVKILNFDQILELYHISKSCKNLPVFVDKQQIIHPKTLVAVRSAIDSVNIVIDPENNQKMISILTNN